MASSKDTPHQTNPNPNASESVTPPAQHVWLAGLGALAKAQQEGSKAIEALVNDGLAFQRKSQTEAQQRLQEATERLSHLTTDFGQPCLKTAWPRPCIGWACPLCWTSRCSTTA